MVGKKKNKPLNVVVDQKKHMQDCQGQDVERLGKKGIDDIVTCIDVLRE